MCAEPAVRPVNAQSYVSRTAKELNLFNRLQPGTEPTRERLRVGTPQFTSAARYDYEQLVRHFGKAQLPAFFRVKVVPTELAAPVKAFAAQHVGKAEVALNTIDGQKSFQVQVATSERTHVLLLGPRGQELARGEVRGAKVSWRWS
jgi:hypothetical protein